MKKPIKQQVVKQFKCEEAVVSFVVREYDATGNVIGERSSDPVKVFRAAVPDIWALMDQNISGVLPEKTEG
jgi:hypothetical protein